MKILSFDTEQNNRIKRDPLQGRLFNLFQKNIVLSQDIRYFVYIVPREFEMRLDRISNYLFGSPNYVEELMVLNDIISPYSVKEGQYIYYCDINSLSLLYSKDDMSDENEINRQKLIASSQPNRENTKFNNTEKNLPLTIKPYNLQQIKVDKDNNIQIINSFE